MSTNNLIQESVEGYGNFQDKIKELKASHPKTLILVVFTGNEKPETGQSWCPDCVQMERCLAKCLPKINPTGILLRVKVGNRDEWKSPSNPFRSDPKLQLTSIPTLIVWGTTKRLEEDEVNEGNIELLFEA